MPSGGQAGRRPPGARGPEPVERVRDQHPSGEEWRADALAKSRHSRLLDEIRAPLEDFDPERAEALCGELCRLALRDFAPALILLPPGERRRVQALAAFALTLFDFADQTGLEGERLAQLNRLEFNLELALAGDPPGQPVFVQLSREQAAGPWPEGSLAAVVDLARGRVMRPRAATGRRAEAEAERLAAALAAPLLGGAEPAAELIALGGGLLRLRALQDGRGARPAEIPWPADGEAAGDPGAPAARLEELERLRPLFGNTRPAVAAPPTYRRAVRFLALAAAKLLAGIEQAPAGGEPAGLGGLARVGLLLRARLTRPS